MQRRKRSKFVAMRTIRIAAGVALAAGALLALTSCVPTGPTVATFEVAGGGRTQVVTPALVARWARVQILSEPGGAQVRVDKQERGVTPLTLELDAGLRSIALSAPGAKDWHGSVLLHGGEAQVVGPVRLSAPDADLTQP